MIRAQKVVINGKFGGDSGAADWLLENRTVWNIGRHFDCNIYVKTFFKKNSKNYLKRDLN